MAIGLSLLVIIAWNYFYGVPQINKAQQTQQAQQTQAQNTGAPPNAATPAAPAAHPESPGGHRSLRQRTRPSSPRPAPSARRQPAHSHRYAEPDGPTTSYMFTAAATSVENNSGGAGHAAIPTALIRRFGTPPTSGYFVLHEGLIGVIGDGTLEEITYDASRRRRAGIAQARATAAGSASPTSTGLPP